MRTKGLFVFMALLVGIAVSASPASAQSQAVDEATLAAFSAELETIRQALHIPGWSVAIVSGQELVWAEGFGYADIEEGIPASAETPYHLASVTKPIAATLLMQLVEEGVVNLNDPVAQYGVRRDNPDITVWHLLTHTSEGVPGTTHQYSGNYYADLGQVIQAATGQPFATLLAERMLVPLNMERTAPNPDWYPGSPAAFPTVMGWTSDLRQTPSVYHDLARPYQFDADYDNVSGSYPMHFSPAAGLLSTVVDIAKFDIALDQGVLVTPATREQMFTPARSNDGDELIYSLGWYTQTYRDDRLVYHSGGWDPSVSALLLKVPDQQLTFILLANNYNLTRPFPLGEGDVLYSTPALAFYKHFVLPRHADSAVPTINWEAPATSIVQQLRQVPDPAVRDLLEHELWSYRKLFASVGRFDRAEMLYTVHQQAFPEYAASRIDPVAYGGNGPVADPQPVSLRPDHVLTIGRFFTAWLLLTLLAFVVLLIDLRRSLGVALPIKLAWLFATLLFGILSWIAYRVSDYRYQRKNGEPMPAWLRAFGPTLYSVTGQVAALLVVLAIVVVYFPDSDGAALFAIPAMFLTGWLLLRGPLAAWARQKTYWQALRHTFFIELASTLPVVIGVLTVLVLVTDRYLRSLGPMSPFYWATLPLAGVAGALLLYPVNCWLVQRGRCDWPAMYQGSDSDLVLSHETLAKVY
ncbi:MAG: serine hydrolase [Anaerolineae bacterium]|nr:serine hydrolase [Anaerolineae bacterium]